MKKLIVIRVLARFSLVASLLAAFTLPAQAGQIIFDAADVLEPGQFAGGIVGELLLENPTSEGIEARFKYGVNNVLNSQAIIGIGSNSRKFRLGAQNYMSIFPDIEGQIGIGVLLSGLYLRSEESGLFVASAGPMLHERFKTAGTTFNVYLGLPLNITLNSGRYFTGSRLVLGSLLEWGSFYGHGEIGFGMGSEQTYVAFGTGVHFNSP